MVLSDRQYAVLVDMFHELPAAFHALPDVVLEAYYARLYGK